MSLNFQGASHTTTQIRQLTDNVSISPREVDVWNKTMFDVLNFKIQVQRSRLNVLQFMKLKSRNVGTRIIENYVKAVARSEGQSRQLRRKLLNHNLGSAQSRENWWRRRFDARLEYLRRRWGGYNYILTQFYTLMQSEAVSVWREGWEKMMTKIKHLEGKYKPKRPEPPSEWEGILISEEKLRAKFEDPKIEAPNYANIQLSEGEKKAAALGPKFTTYETITKHKINVAAEELVTKLRWESRSREEREGEWSEEWEWDQVK